MVAGFLNIDTRGIPSAAQDGVGVASHGSPAHIRFRPLIQPLYSTRATVFALPQQGGSETSAADSACGF